MAIANPVTKTLAATGVTDEFIAKAGAARGVRQYFNVSIAGITTATVQVQRSFDDGTTWKVVSSHTADAELQLFEAEPNVQYRLEVTAWTSGTLLLRISA
jgi:hypothetical protein